MSWITFRGRLWNNGIFPALSSVKIKVLRSKFTSPGSQPARGLSIYMRSPVLTHDLTREESQNGGHKLGWPDRLLGKFPASFDLFSRMLWVVWGQHCICNSVTFRAMSKFHLLVKLIIRRREINKGRGDWRGWSVWPFQDCSCSPWRGFSGGGISISSSMYTSEMSNWSIILAHKATCILCLYAMSCQWPNQSNRFLPGLFPQTDLNPITSSL